jgi:hypothetical protein
MVLLLLEHGALTL